MLQYQKSQICDCDTQTHMRSKYGNAPIETELSLHIHKKQGGTKNHLSQWAGGTQNWTTPQPYLYVYYRRTRGISPLPTILHLNSFWSKIVPQQN